MQKRSWQLLVLKQAGTSHWHKKAVLSGSGNAKKCRIRVLARGGRRCRECSTELAETGCRNRHLRQLRLIAFQRHFGTKSLLLLLLLFEALALVRFLALLGQLALFGRQHLHLVNIRLLAKVDLVQI